jgi:hypothetical protein
VISTKECHVWTCANGHQHTSGDKFHHMRPENFFACDCGAPVGKIVCPEGCNQLPWTNSDLAGQVLRKKWGDGT